MLIHTAVTPATTTNTTIYTVPVLKQLAFSIVMTNISDVIVRTSFSIDNKEIIYKQVLQPGETIQMSQLTAVAGAVITGNTTEGNSINFFVLGDLTEA